MNVKLVRQASVALLLIVTFCSVLEKVDGYDAKPKSVTSAIRGFGKASSESKEKVCNSLYTVIVCYSKRNYFSAMKYSLTCYLEINRVVVVKIPNKN